MSCKVCMCGFMCHHCGLEATWTFAVETEGGDQRRGPKVGERDRSDKSALTLVNECQIQHNAGFDLLQRSAILNISCFPSEKSQWREKNPRHIPWLFSGRTAKTKQKKRESCLSLQGAVCISTNRNPQAPSGVDVINEQTSSCSECAGVCSLGRIRQQIDSI